MQTLTNLIEKMLLATRFIVFEKVCACGVTDVGYVIVIWSSYEINHLSLKLGFLCNYIYYLQSFRTQESRNAHEFLHISSYVTSFMLILHKPTYYAIFFFAFRLH